MARVMMWSINAMVSRMHDPQEGQETNVPNLAGRSLVVFSDAHNFFLGNTSACAHRLQQQWHTVDPPGLGKVARDLRRDERLRAMPPDLAAIDWRRPITE
jgi:hypothetical protein